MRAVVILYVLGMMLFWMEGEGTEGWNTYYYSLEKLFSASGFILLAFHTDNKNVKQLAIYASAICLFMFLYFIYCMIFGHSMTVAVTSLMFYSLIILYLLKK